MMPIYQTENIEIYYPNNYINVAHLSIPDFSKSSIFFDYKTSMVVCNRLLPKTNSHFVFAFCKYWFGSMYIDCFVSNGAKYDLESACEEINAYMDIGIYTFIERIPSPSINDVLMDDWD